jgi:hypothetical protein
MPGTAVRRHGRRRLVQRLTLGNFRKRAAARCTKVTSGRWWHHQRCQVHLGEVGPGSGRPGTLGCHTLGVDRLLACPRSLESPRCGGWHVTEPDLTATRAAILRPEKPESNAH